MRARLAFVILAIVAVAAAPLGHASASRRARRVASEVVITSVSADGTVTGVVTSPKDVCTSGRKVHVTRDGTGIGAADTDGGGDWFVLSSSRPAVGDRFTATIDRVVVRSGARRFACASGSDSFVHNG